MTPHGNLVPALMAPFIAWRLYYRFRRNVGRQRFQQKRLTAAIVIFGSLSLVFLAMLTRIPRLCAGFGGGLLLGIPMALIGLHFTRFESTPEGKFYTPNTFIGIGLTLLLVGRLIYRGYMLYTGVAELQGKPAAFQSPLTLVFFGLTAGYYIAYYAGVCMRSRRE